MSYSGRNMTFFSHRTKSQCLFIWSLGAAHILAAVKANINKRNKGGKEQSEKRAAHSNNSK